MNGSSATAGSVMSLNPPPTILQPSAALPADRRGEQHASAAPDGIGQPVGACELNCRQARVAGCHGDVQVGIGVRDRLHLVSEVVDARLGWVVPDRDELGHDIGVCIGPCSKGRFVRHPEVIVHDQACDLDRQLVGEVLLDPGAPQGRLGGVGQLQARRPRVHHRVAPRRVPADHEWLRDALGVQPVVHRENVRRAERRD